MCRQMHNIDRRKKNIVTRKKKVKKERKYSENYCNWCILEFSTVFIMKQDFDIGALGYLIIKFQINSHHSKELKYHFIRFCSYNNLKSTVKM